MLQSAPVGPNDSAGQAGGSVYQAGNRQMGGSSRKAPNYFTGEGNSLASPESGANTGGVLGTFGMFGRKSEGRNGENDLTDRREKARKAALARFDRKDANSTGVVKHGQSTGLKSS